MVDVLWKEGREDVAHHVAAAEVDPGILVHLAAEKAGAVRALFADDLGPFDVPGIVDEQCAALAAGDPIASDVRPSIWARARRSASGSTRSTCRRSWSSSTGPTRPTIAVATCPPGLMVRASRRALPSAGGSAWTHALSGACGAGLDPCAALQRVVALAPGQSIEVVFFLGQCESAQSAREVVARYRSADLDAVLDEVGAHWQGLLGAVQVKTPDRAMDIMLNGWLLYQTIACRIRARSAFYQASGAYGFRDQLQDGMALSLALPQETRTHLLRAAGRQFEAGDVQHWWLPHSGQGVRTQISDDRVWLAYAAATYILRSGDEAVLDEPVPFLEGPPLARPIRRFVVNDVGPTIEARALQRIGAYVGQGGRYDSVQQAADAMWAISATFGVGVSIHSMSAPFCSEVTQSSTTRSIWVPSRNWYRPEARRVGRCSLPSRLIRISSSAASLMSISLVSR